MQTGDMHDAHAPRGKNKGAPPKSGMAHMMVTLSRVKVQAGSGDPLIPSSSSSSSPPPTPPPPPQQQQPAPPTPPPTPAVTEGERIETAPATRTTTTTTTTSARETTSTGDPSSIEKMVSQQWFGLSVLFTINTINFLDRLSIAAVLSEIEKYYELTHSQSGLLSTCFLVGYMMTAPIFGYLGDKYSRKWIIVGGIVFWSLSAFGASIMSKQHYMLFYISRMLVGVGEASYSTLAPTIIADLFEPNRRKLALSIFYFAIPIGSGLGFLMGTLALTLGDWRWVFRITPAIGLIATAFLLLLKEPVRGQSDGNSVEFRDNSTVKDNLKYLSTIRSYVWSTVGFTCCLYAMGALSWYAITFMGEARGKDYETTATMIFGGIVCAAGFVGVTLGSTSAQYFRQFDGRADPVVCAIGIFVAVPLTFMGLVFAKSITGLAWVLLFLAVTALSTNWAVVSDMLLSVTLPHKRAFATAIQIMLSHLCGDAASPFITGFIRDELNLSLKDEYLSFLYALLSTLIILTLGAVAFLYSAKFFVQDVEECRSAMSRQAETEEQTRTSSSYLTDFATLS